ncbi:MAG: Acetyltransferase (GNAT) family protein [bacterium ADurb.Bin212]|nr:MAG: Acetyltransferase (GNAT) family protein [bacterium ADurb.Bin212]
MADRNSKIRISLPVTENDFIQANDIINCQVVRDSDWGIDYFKSLSVGEMLIAKIGPDIVGVIVQRYPGRIFEEMEDKYFSLDKIICDKKNYGYVVLIAVHEKYQGMGIGKKLLKKSLIEQKNIGAKAVGVHCWQSSPGNASQKLFESFGFEPLKLHKKTWYEHSKKVGIDNFECTVCGNPCSCDDFEMIKYI